MSTVVYRITTLLSRVLQPLPRGTNLGLFHLLWMLMSGRLLDSRGAVIPALAALGLAPQTVRRAWAALAYGQWHIAPLLLAWQQQVRGEGEWQPFQAGGYRPVAADLTGFFRPRLTGCATKHYQMSLGKELPALPLGILARIGAVGDQRLALPCGLQRPPSPTASTPALQGQLLQQAAQHLEAHDLMVVDAGFSLAQVQAAGIPRYLVRGARNFAARRACLPPYRGHGRRPTRGSLVRPLPRCRKGRTIAATPPDREEVWEAEGVRLRACFWEALVGSDGYPGEPTFTCIVIHDPRHRQPLLLLTNQPLSGRQALALYRARWAIEQLPLASKQMLGAVRQFVFASESRQRLPELALLAGAILSYAAATTPAVPSGFWDRRPRRTVGRLRRLLSSAPIPEVAALPWPLRKKASPTEHLPKGIAGHRRHKPGAAHAPDLRLAA